jgi:hypothetical protein
MNLTGRAVLYFTKRKAAISYLRGFHGKQWPSRVKERLEFEDPSSGLSTILDLGDRVVAYPSERGKRR